MYENRGLLSASWRIANLWWELNKEKALHSPSASAGFFIVQSLQKQAFDGSPIKNPGAFAPGLFLCSGGRIRTSDLWVMSPTSYHCSTPQCGCKINTSKAITKGNNDFYEFISKFASNISVNLQIIIQIIYWFKLLVASCLVLAGF
jgi:hypothetical protein